MSTTLEPQIRELSQAFDAAIEPVTIEEVLGGIETSTLAARRPRRSVWVYAVALGAIVLLPLMLLANRWLSDEVTDDPTSTSTTLEGSPTTTVPTTVGNLPSAAGVGWTFAEIETPMEQGRLSVGWAADGAPLVTTSGLHCVDVNGVPKWNYSNDFSPGEGCEADGDASGVFMGHGWIGGSEWVDHPAFPGKIVYPDGVIGGLTNQIVCDQGPPSAECSYWASLDGVSWFEPDKDGDIYHSMLHGEWSRDGNDVMVQVLADEPGRVTWYVSTDGGITFPDLLEGSDTEHAAVFTIDGRHRLLKWTPGASEPTLHEYDTETGWRSIGEVSGLPATASLCTIDNCGPTTRAYRVQDGTVWLVATVGQFASGATLFYSTDSGTTWIEPSRGTRERPFAAFGDAFEVGFVGGWLVVRPDGDYHAATRGTQWYRIPAGWSDNRNPSPSNPTTYVSMPIPPGGARSVVESDGSDESTQSAVLAGLPQGWRIVELTLGRDEGVFEWVYGPDGLPRVLSTGFHCVDGQGNTRINEAGDDGFGDVCTGALVETPTATFYVATPSGDWVEHADPFDGYQAILFNSSRVLTQAVVCPPGTTAERRGTCSISATDDGTGWYEPLGDDGPIGLASNDPLLGWDQIARSILVPEALPGNTSSGQPRTPTAVQWHYSTDGGRTFTAIATEPATVTQEFGIATHFTFNGAFRSIIWDDDGDGTLRELDEDLIWQPIGIVTGLPGPGGSEPFTYLGDTRLLGTASGTVFMADLRDDFGPGTLKHVSHDGGLTWTELEPMTSEMPFRVGEDVRARDGYPYVTWATRIAGWLLFNTDQGLFLTDGSTWHVIPDSALSIEWDGNSKRDPVTIRLPAFIGP